MWYDLIYIVHNERITSEAVKPYSINIKRKSQFNEVALEVIVVVLEM